MTSCKPWLAALLLLFIPLLSQAADEPEQADVRILIDISGSMKQNDPKNLRRPALRLLVGLMPSGTRAGVWTFGQWTNMLVPLGIIDEGWKKRARKVSEKIGHPGQFTNIEEVLRRATEDWDGPPGNFRRNVILLTDGMVDISKNNKLDQESQQRILEEIVPRLKQLGVTVHTIALSPRADGALMQAIADQTGGWFEQVDTAEQLQRVFLRMFEKVGKPDAVPLKDNKFTIDGSIDEATVLVFRQPGSPDTRIIPPGGQPFTAEDAPDTIGWHRDEGYDLITMSQPAAGEWRIQADIDPDNRVMVVTDLKMKTTDLPNRIALGESLPVEVLFTENGKQVTRKEFIDVMEITAAQGQGGELGEAQPLRDDGKEPDEAAGDGKFSVLLGQGSDLGKVELVIDAEGKTFMRQRRQATEVVAPAQITTDGVESGDTVSLQVRFDPEVVMPETESVQGWAEALDGKRVPIEFNKQADNQWQATVDKKSLLGRHFLMVSASGKTRSGNDFSYAAEPVGVEGMAPPPAAKAEPAPAVEPEKPAEPEPLPEPEEETDWLMIGLIVGGINLLLILIGVGVWWFLRKRGSKEDVVLLDDETDITPEPEQAEVEAAK